MSAWMRLGGPQYLPVESSERRVSAMIGREIEPMSPLVKLCFSCGPLLGLRADIALQDFYSGTIRHLTKLVTADLALHID